MEIQWSLVLFTALTGAAGWTFACIAADEFLKKAPKAGFIAGVAALALLIVGGLCSVTHLSHPENILSALNHPTSGIFVEAVLTGLAVLFGFLYLVVCKREASEGARKGMAIAAAAFGVILSFMAGESYMMAAQTTWNTFLLPLGYLGTAIPAGVALYLVCACVADKEADLKQYAQLLLIGGIIAAVTVLAYAVVSGSFATAAIFAVLSVCGAGIVPIVAGFYLPKVSDKAMVLASAALACTVIGAICYRCMMWVVASPLVDFFSLL